MIGALRRSWSSCSSLAFTAIWGTFTSAMWTIFFRRLTGREVLVAIPAGYPPPQRLPAYPQPRRRRAAAAAVRRYTAAPPRPRPTPRRTRVRAAAPAPTPARASVRRRLRPTAAPPAPPAPDAPDA